MILKFLLYVLLVILLYRIVKSFFKGYFFNSSNNSDVYSKRRVESKYKDVEEASYTEIKDDKEKNK